VDVVDLYVLLLPGDTFRERTGVALARMERIDVTSGRPPSVHRPEGSKTLFLTFDGLRGE
jgi:hypothetical protein